jgi:hypothetical protein
MKNLKKKFFFSTLCSSCILLSFGLGSVIINAKKTENSITNKKIDKIISLIEPYKCHCESAKNVNQSNESNSLNEIIDHYNEENKLEKNNSINVDNYLSNLQKEILENVNVNVVKNNNGKSEGKIKNKIENLIQKINNLTKEVELNYEEIINLNKKSQEFEKILKEIEEKNDLNICPKDNKKITEEEEINVIDLNENKNKSFFNRIFNQTAEIIIPEGWQRINLKGKGLNIDVVVPSGEYKLLKLDFSSIGIIAEYHYFLVPKNFKYEKTNAFFNFSNNYEELFPDLKDKKIKLLDQG